MRTNVYAEELTGDVRFIQPLAHNGRNFPAIRFYLESANALHKTDEDDDRSAVTFWIPKGRKHEVVDMFRRAAGLIEQNL